MTPTIFDLNALYKQYFNTSPYYVTPKDSEKPLTQEVSYSAIAKNPHPRGKIHSNKDNIAFNKIGAYGQEIWGQITFNVNKDLIIEIEACTVAVNLSKQLIKTNVSDRKGMVIERFNIDNYRFTIKGFLINKNREFPEVEINTLKQIFESTEKVELHGGYPEMFLDKSCQVVIETLDFPEVQGKSRWIRPFSLVCLSDLIEDLTINN